MNILVLTSVYPGNDISTNFTSVVHYFTKEWIKCHNVKVIHTVTYFPKFYYYIPTFIKTYLMKKVGFAFPQKRITTPDHYEFDGVEVYRLPIYKRIPMGRYSSKVLNKQIKNINSILYDIKFIPDLIVCHWINPQVFLSAHLKNEYPKSKISLVIHENAAHFKLLPDYDNLMSKIDYWGYRSELNRKNFESIFNNRPNWFRCYSGIPQSFLERTEKRNYTSTNRIAFIGQLIPRKYPDIVIKALSQSFPNGNFVCNIIGNGPMFNQLESLAGQLNVKNQIKLLGEVARNEIIKYLDNTDIFVMISRGEVFGLVYLEAMARGCLVVASKDEGMEGIIADGINGFLCEAGNQHELESILANIQSMSPIERMKISNCGIETAKQLTDDNAAQTYLNNITK